MILARRTKIVILLPILLHAMPLSAQTVRGHVIDSEGSPISGVEIHNSRTGGVAYSDEVGGYVISNEVYPVDLLFISDEHRLYIKTLPSYVEGGIDTIMLLPLEVALNEVIISERRKMVYNLRQLRDVEGTAIYAGKKTEVVVLDNTLGNLASNNARQIYGQVAGINIYEGTDAGLQLNIGGRGLDPNRSANFNTRQNGYDISADVLGYPESYYTPPAEALQEIQIIRGAASLQYGTQFGGLVNFIMRDPPVDKSVSVQSRQSVGSFGLINSFNRVAGTKGKVSYQAYYHLKRGNGWRPNSDFASNHAFAQITYNVLRKTSLTAEVTYLSYLAQQPGGLTDAQFYDDPSFSNRERNFFDVDWLLYQLRLDHEFSETSRISLSVFGLDAQRSALGFRTNRVSQVDDVSQARDLIQGTFRNVGMEGRYLLRYPLWGNTATTLIGAKVYISDNQSTQGPGSAGDGVDFTFAREAFPSYPAQSDFRFPNHNLAVFAEQIIEPLSNLKLTPGVRVEHIQTESQGSFRRIDFDLAGNPIRDRLFRDDRVFDRTFALLGLGISYQDRSSTEIYGNLSQNYRSVTFNDIRTVNPTFQVDPNISDESGYTMDIGARGTLGRYLSYDIGGYGLVYDDRIGEVLRREIVIDANGMESESGRIVRTRSNIGRAVILGLETYAEIQLHRLLYSEETDYALALWSNVALTTSEYTDSDEPGVIGNVVEFVPRYNVKAGVKVGYRNTLIQLQYTTLAEQYTDASNAAQNRMDNQSGIRGAIPSYTIWDLALSHRYRQWTIETGINNLLDTSYFTRRATGYPGPGILPSDPRSFYLTVGVSI